MFTFTEVRHFLDRGCTHWNLGPLLHTDMEELATFRRRLFPIISGYFHPLLNTLQSSCPLCKITPKPPSRFTVGMVFLGLCSGASILVSPDHTTFSRASYGSSRWSLANFRRARTCDLAPDPQSRQSFWVFVALAKLLLCGPVVHPSSCEGPQSGPWCPEAALVQGGSIGSLCECVDRCLLCR